MAKVCSPGTIKRKAYTRKAYTRSDGTHVKATRVAASCVPDRGTVGRGKKVVKTPLKKGELKMFGYSVSEPAADRRHALSLAIRHYGDATSVFRKVNLLATFQKNTNPVMSRKFKADANWISKMYL